MTPEEFTERMRNVHLERSWAQYPNTYDDHMEADKLMCQLLREMGFGEGVEVFEKMEKNYSSNELSEG